MAGRGKPKTGGRQRGTPNKATALLKDAVLQAAELAGDKAGMVGYLTTQAKINPTAFMSLLGRVLPMQLEGAGDTTSLSLSVSYVAALEHNPSNLAVIDARPEPITIDAEPTAVGSRPIR